VSDGWRLSIGGFHGVGRDANSLASIDMKAILPGSMVATT